MPHKGFFSQGLVVLVSKQVSLDDVEKLLKVFGTPSRKPAATNWEFGGPAIVVPYRPQVNGYVSIDLVDQAWPDDMGHPQQNPTLFACWSMGHFGPYAYPHNLARALEQSWNWPEAKQLVPGHRAFIRLRSSYIFGTPEGAKCLPEDYAPFPELQFLTGIAQALMRHPHALAYFNPGGELLMSEKGLDDALQFSKAHSLPPLDVWSNVRLLISAEGWLLMDTAGMGQLDLPDHEACFRKGAYQPNQIANFLRNAALYLLNHGEVVKDGNTMDGPGNCRWKAKSFDNGLSSPPRRVLRWLPCDGSTPPKQVVGG